MQRALAQRPQRAIEVVPARIRHEAAAFLAAVVLDGLTLVYRLRHLADAELKTAYQHAEAAGHDRIADACAEEMAHRTLED